MSIIVAGIHTGIGKTVCSAIICQAFGYDYWKPVQAGDLANSDSIFIRKHVDNPACTIHPERYQLLTAASPHHAAELEGKIITQKNLVLPVSPNPMVVETAGGLMSPLATDFLMIDLIKSLALPVVLVSNNYLGSINHTLLSLAALTEKKIPVRGIVFVGEKTISTEKYILEYSKTPFLFSMPFFEKLDRECIHRFSLTLPDNMFQG